MTKIICEHVVKASYSLSWSRLLGQSITDRGQGAPSTVWFWLGPFAKLLAAC